MAHQSRNLTLYTVVYVWRGCADSVKVYHRFLSWPVQLLHRVEAVPNNLIMPVTSAVPVPANQKWRLCDIRGQRCPGPLADFPIRLINLSRSNAALARRFKN